MRVIILGSGTCASGIPGIPDRQPPAFLVEWDEDGLTQRVLFDCSEGVRFRLEAAGVNYTDIRHVAISHTHPDHCAIFHFCQSLFCKGLFGGEKFWSPELSIYCPNTLVRNFKRMWAFHTPETPVFPFPTIRLMRMSSRIAVPEYRGFGTKTVRMSSRMRPVRIGSAKLFALPVYHGFGKVDALAFRLETPSGTFVYSGDTGECAGIRGIAQHADIFVCEASALIGDEKNPHEYGHLNPRLAGEIARETGVKKLVFFHYTGINSDEEIIADCRRGGYTGPVVVGKDRQLVDAG